MSLLWPLSPASSVPKQGCVGSSGHMPESYIPLFGVPIPSAQTLTLSSIFKVDAFLGFLFRIFRGMKSTVNERSELSSISIAGTKTTSSIHSPKVSSFGVRGRRSSLVSTVTLTQASMWLCRGFDIFALGYGCDCRIIVWRYAGYCGRYLAGQVL